MFVRADTKEEPDETFKVKLSNVQGSGNVPANSNLPVGVGTIVNDDSGDTLSIDPSGEVSYAALTKHRGEYHGGYFRVITEDVAWKVSVQSNFIKLLCGFTLSPCSSDTGRGTKFINYVVRESHLGTPARTDSILIERLDQADAPLRLVIKQVAGREECKVALTGIICVFNILQDQAGIRITNFNFRAGADGSAVPPTLRDFDGDGLEEIGVLGPELHGEARGAWVQLFNSKGRRLMNFFPGAEFPAMLLQAMDTDGNRKAEPVFLGIEESGAAELQLRSSKGATQDRQQVSPAGTRSTWMFSIEYDGQRGEEIVIAHEAKNGTGRFAVWDTSSSGKKLQLLDEHSIIDSKSARHQWLPLDVDNDGRDEIVATYAGPSGKGTTLRIVDPRTGTTLANKKILSTGFDQAVWTVGDFDPDRPGAELLVGHRKTQSRGFFKVIAGNGAVLSTSKSITAKPLHTWGAIRSKPGPKGTVRDLVFVGFTRLNGDAAFEVWDPRITAPEGAKNPMRECDPRLAIARATSSTGSDP